MDNLPPRYSVGQAVDLLVVERTEMGFKAIIEGKHWGLIHKNEAFKPAAACANRATSRNCARTARSPLSLQPVGAEAAVELSQQILARLLEAGGSLPLSDKVRRKISTGSSGSARGPSRRPSAASTKA